MKKFFRAIANWFKNLKNKTNESSVNTEPQTPNKPREPASSDNSNSNDPEINKIAKMWAACQIDIGHRALVLNIAKKIQANKSRYLKVEEATGVPWFVVGCIHSKEASLNFNKVLHNGELLSDVNSRGTRLVPKGRGKGLNWTWETAAIDAMRYDKMDKKDLSSIPKILDACERYNGLGYRRKGIPSIYLWSHTNQSTERGKYVADGVWDSNAISKNAGVASFLVALRELGEDLT